MQLLNWQSDCLVKYSSSQLNPTFTIVAGTGSGKTLAGAHCAAQTFHENHNAIIIGVCPGNAVKSGWVDALASAGVMNVTADNNNAANPHLDGIICHYSMANQMINYARLWDRPIILILDEFHHLEENNSWAETFNELRIGISQPCIKAILLSGTPWHEGGSIPDHLVRYDSDDCVMADKLYPYGYAVNESDNDQRNVCPIEFKRVDGKAVQSCPVTGDDRDLDTRTMEKSDPLTPFVEFTNESIAGFPNVIEAVESGIKDLTALRKTHKVNDESYPGGLIIVKGKMQAEAMFNYLRSAYGITATVVTSEHYRAQDEIVAFRDVWSKQWLIAVDMISEGVDIPRLKVMIDLTNKVTKMHMVQRWGRVVRRFRYRDPADPSKMLFAPDCSAIVYIVNHPKVSEMAAHIEDEIKSPKKEKAPGDGEAPERIHFYETDRVEDVAHSSLASGVLYETEVANLALWMWSENYINLREMPNHRGHTDLLFFAKDRIDNNNVPDEYTNPPPVVIPIYTPTYDERKQTLVTETNNVTNKIAHHLTAEDNFAEARRMLNKLCGVKKYSSKGASIEQVEERLQKAKTLLAEVTSGQN